MSSSSGQEDVLTSHNYDGIQEYDNPLPGWWVWLFVGTIVFSFFYWIYYHSGVEGRSIHDQLEQKTAQVFEMRFAEIGELTPDRATILEYMEKEEWLTVGRVTFKANCVSCHGQEGGGNVGPNLTDDYWKNVKTVEDIAQVIEEGAANGAMPAWRNKLHINQIVLVAAYIASIRGEDVGGKQPEGEKIPEWGEPSAEQPSDQ